MSMWLYQIDAQNWSPQRYRLEIWEGERWAWPVGRKVLQGKEPQPGDIVVFYNTPSGGKDHGFYGWSVVARVVRRRDGDVLQARCPERFAEDASPGVTTHSKPRQPYPRQGETGYLLVRVGGIEVPVAGRHLPLGWCNPAKPQAGVVCRDRRCCRTSACQLTSGPWRAGAPVAADPHR